MRLFYEQALEASGADLQLVRVPDEQLPEDLVSTDALSQHLLARPAKANGVLGWQDAADSGVLHRSVAWHREHPPTDADHNLAADVLALALKRPID